MGLIWLLCAAVTACAPLPPDVALPPEVAHAAQESAPPAAESLSPPAPSPAVEPARPATTPISPAALSALEPAPPSASEFADLPCSQAPGSVSAISVPSARLRYPIDARLYLPPCYAASDERYPVLYLIHGLNFKEDQWVNLGAAQAADALIVAGEIAPLVIVMPRDRLDPRLDSAFVEDLIPFVDEHYRTLPTRAGRAIGGLSRGGGWAVHIGLRYPEAFSRIGAHSPAVFVGDEHNLVQWTWRLPKDLPLEVYVDTGQNDSLVHSAAWLDQVLTYAGIPHTYLLRPGAHSEQYWATHLAEYLRFYAAEWRSIPPPPPGQAPAPPSTR